MGLSLVAGPLVTLISTIYTYLTVSSQDLHRGERTLVFLSLSYHLWYVFPRVYRIFSGDSCVSAIAHMHGKSVEVRVQPWGWVLMRPAWLQKTLEKPELLHVRPVFLQRDTLSPGRLKWMSFNNLMICYCFPQTPEHCFSADKIHPHERDPTVANRTAIMFITNCSSLDPHPEHPSILSQSVEPILVEGVTGALHPTSV